MGGSLKFSDRPMVQMMVAVVAVRVQVRQQRRLWCSSGRRLLQHRGHAVRNVRWPVGRVNRRYGRVPLQWPSLNEKQQQQRRQDGSRRKKMTKCVRRVYDLREGTFVYQLAVLVQTAMSRIGRQRVWEMISGGRRDGGCAARKCAAARSVTRELLSPVDGVRTFRLPAVVVSKGSVMTGGSDGLASVFSNMRLRRDAWKTRTTDTTTYHAFSSPKGMPRVGRVRIRTHTQELVSVREPSSPLQGFPHNPSRTTTPCRPTRVVELFRYRAARGV